MKTLLLLVVLFISQTIFGQGYFIDHRHTDLSQIPESYINKAKQELKIRYFRRSHGSHVDVGGMAALRRYSTTYQNLYAYNKTGAGGELHLSTQASNEPWNSLDFENATWVQITRDYLDDAANSGINVVMWAWSSKFYLCDATQYLNDMETLISEYGEGGSKNRPVPVTFIFQTACGQSSPSRNQIVYEQNEEIRDWCKSHNRILYDFNDIECYNPDGEYFGDGDANGDYTSVRMLNDDLSYNSGSRNWGIEWNNANSSSELAELSADDVCVTCEHSMGHHEGETKDNSRLHCVLKGRAAWWLWAKLAGWGDGYVGTNDVKTNLNKNDLKNYPNPFTHATTIEYSVENNAHVKLELWDSSGKKVVTLVDNNQAKGNYSIPIEINEKAGMYFYTLNINGKQVSNKMLKTK